MAKNPEQNEVLKDYSGLMSMGLEATQQWNKMIIQWMKLWAKYQRDSTEAFMKMQRQGMKDYMHFLESLADRERRD